MIEKLRHKFILITMASVFVVMAVILTALNVTNYLHARDRADEVLTVLAENGGTFPQLELSRANDDLEPGDLPPGGNLSPETPFETRFFKVVADAQGQVTQIDTSRVRAVDSGAAREYAEAVLAEGKERGYTGDFRYWNVLQEDGSRLLLFMDSGRELQTFRNFLQNSILIGAASLLMIFLLVVFFSKKVVAPVQRNLDKQKRFITDAGHEIKTPLSIISANNDVQELLGESNEWTQSTRNQITRLNGLVEDMLRLSRMEEEPALQVHEAVNLGQLVAEEAEPFRLLCEQEGISFRLSCEEDITVEGERESLRKVCSILLDNAHKYVSPKGQVTVALTRRKKNAILMVANTVEEMPADFERLFDRFYRESASRNQSTGGYGIGLSLAQAIVTQHGGTIKARAVQEGIIQFEVTLPLQQTS